MTVQEAFLTDPGKSSLEAVRSLTQTDCIWLEYPFDDDRGPILISAHQIEQLYDFASHLGLVPLR